MEVWRDFQTGKFFRINVDTGMQTPSNRFGSVMRTFSAYSSGYPHQSSASELPMDKGYSIQPNKFDGYYQFPRPIEKRTASSSVYTRKPIKINRIRIKNNHSIPQPLKHLNKSQSRGTSISPTRSTKAMSTSSSKPEVKSIESLKKTFIKPPNTVISTLCDQTIKLETEKILKAGYQKPKSKEVRRVLKGFFVKNYNTSADLCKIEKSMLEITNPALFQRLKRFEDFDRKSLEKKCNATRLLFTSGAAQ